MGGTHENNNNNIVLFSCTPVSTVPSTPPFFFKIFLTNFGHPVKYPNLLRVQSKILVSINCRIKTIHPHKLSAGITVLVSP